MNGAFLGIIALTVVCLGSIAAWLWHLTKRFVPTALVPLVLAVWLAIAFALASSGFLSNWTAKPPRMPLIPLVAFVALIAVHRSAAFVKLLRATPRHWPVALQTFRIGVELCFWRLYVTGGAPQQVTFEGRNFDVVVGLTAPVVALAIWKYGMGRRIVIVWNVLGIAILGNTIVTALSSLPGPLHHDWPGGVFTAIADSPFVLIPAFLAPFAIFLHVFSIRQRAAP